MENHLRPRDDLDEEERELEAALAAVRQKKLERAQVEEASRRITELRNQHSTLVAQIIEEQSSYTQDEKKRQVKDDARKTATKAAKAEMSTVDQKVKILKIQLQEAEDEGSSMKSRLEELEKEQTAANNETHKALKDWHERKASLESSAASVHTELEQRKKELHELECKAAAHTTPDTDSSMLQSTQAAPTRGEIPIQEEPAREDDQLIKNSTPISEHNTALPEASSVQHPETDPPTHKPSSVYQPAQDKLDFTAKGGLHPSSVARNNSTRPSTPRALGQTHSSAPLLSSAPSAKKSNNVQAGPSVDSSQPAAALRAGRPQQPGENSSIESPVSASEPSHHPTRSGRPPMSTLTHEQIALKRHYAQTYAPRAGLNRRHTSNESPSTPETPVTTKAASKQVVTDKEKRKSIENVEKPGMIYGQETHECSLNAQYPTVVYVKESDSAEGHWCELRCFVCDANMSVGQLGFFSSVTRLVQHISHKHGQYPRNEVVSKCIVRLLSSEDVQLLGEEKEEGSESLIEKTFGDVARRDWMLKNHVMVPADDGPSNASAADEPIDRTIDETNEESDEGVHHLQRRVSQDVQPPALMAGTSRIFDIDGPNGDRTIYTPLGGNGNGFTHLEDDQKSVNRPILLTNPGPKLQLPTEQRADRSKQSNVAGQGLMAHHVIHEQKAFAPPPGRSVGLNKFGHRNGRQAIEVSSASEPRHESADFFKPFTTGQKRAHSEVSPREPSSLDDTFRPDCPATAYIHGGWCAISCRKCSANADRLPDGTLRFFDGLNGVFDHAMKSHRSGGIDRKDIITFAWWRHLPSATETPKASLVGSRIVPHAGDKILGKVSRDAVPVKNISILHGDFPATAHFDDYWFHISCPICSANASKPTRFFRGLIELARHVRFMHGKETDFNDVRPWCAMSGPIDQELIRKINRPDWDGSYKVDLLLPNYSQGNANTLVPDSHTPRDSLASSRVRSRDPRLYNRDEASKHIHERNVERDDAHLFVSPHSASEAPKALRNQSKSRLGPAPSTPSCRRDPSASPKQKTSRREVEIEFRRR